eukprot:195008-Hanusia_phi.AAC.1
MEYMESKKTAKYMEALNCIDKKEVVKDFLEALDSAGKEEALRASAVKAIRRCVQLSEEESRTLEGYYLDMFNNTYKILKNTRHDHHHQLCALNKKIGGELLWKDFRVRGVSKRTLRRVLDEAANYLHR